MVVQCGSSLPIMLIAGIRSTRSFASLGTRPRVLRTERLMGGQS